MAIGLEPACTSIDGHVWTNAHDMVGPEPVMLDGEEILEEHCERRGCYVIRGIIPRNDINDPDVERPHVLYYGALAPHAVLEHGERYGDALAKPAEGR